jgi:saccharopine dehydrogenase-like NADP-dependent oxidoreductase
MARTTGFACTAAVELVLSGKFNRIGISPPEFIGENEECFNYMLNYQAERGVNYIMTSK